MSNESIKKAVGELEAVAFCYGNSTDAVDAIANKHGVDVDEMLVAFKQRTGEDFYEWFDNGMEDYPS